MSKNSFEIIECKNTSCDHRVESTPGTFLDKTPYVNTICPKCKEVFFTEEDYLKEEKWKEKFVEKWNQETDSILKANPNRKPVYLKNR